jgi:predicted double-glycine peptidase
MELEYKADETLETHMIGAHVATIKKLKLQLCALFVICLALLVGLIISLENQQTTKKNPASPLLPSSFALLNIPIVRQATDYTCGVASLSSVLDAFGFTNVSEAELAVECASNNVFGTEYARIVNASANRNLTVTVGNGWTTNDLKQFIFQNVAPVIVVYQAWIQQPGCDWSEKSCTWTKQQWMSNYNDGHYSVIIGWNETHLLLMDPSQDPDPTAQINSVPYGVILNEQFDWRWHDTDGYATYLQHLGIGFSSSSRKLQGSTTWWPDKYHVAYTF